MSSSSFLPISDNLGTIMRATAFALLALSGILAPACGPSEVKVKCQDQPPVCPDGFVCSDGYCVHAKGGVDASALDGSLAGEAGLMSAVDGSHGPVGGLDANPGVDQGNALDQSAGGIDLAQGADVPLSFDVGADEPDAATRDSALQDVALPAPDSHGNAGADTQLVPLGPDARDGQEGDAARGYDESAGIFVLSSAPANSNCGDRGIPCQTIKQGIARAKATGRTIVYVGAGTYIEQVPLSAGIRVEGDWSVLGSTWTPIYTNPGDAVVIQGPTDPAAYQTVEAPVLAKDLGGAATLALVTVKSKASAGSGESLYGVFAAGATTNLTLENVKVIVANAGSGVSAPVSVGGAAGVKGGCDRKDAGTGAAVAAGAPGVDGLATGFGVGGYAAGNGTPGAKGQDGNNGPAGSTAGPAVSCGSCASAHSTSCTTYSSVGTDAKPGCGGKGGPGGGAGTGGGSSIALYVWDATVNVVGGALQSGNGGNGGLGAEGGAGGRGVDGVDGNPGSDCYSCSITDDWEGSPSTHVYYCNQSSKAAGTPGLADATPGSDGGPGGKGGSGAGGSSFAVFSNVKTSVGTSTAMTPGKAGASGGGQAGPGKAAQAGGPDLWN